MYEQAFWTCYRTILVDGECFRTSSHRSGSCKCSTNFFITSARLNVGRWTVRRCIRSFEDFCCRKAAGGAPPEGNAGSEVLTSSGRGTFLFHIASG